MSHTAVAARNIGAKFVRRALGVHKPVVRLARRAERLREQLQCRRDEIAIERQIAAVARGTAPIIAGPWLGEVGYEALYWIPFLRWFENVHRVDPERVVALSRGGVDAWYSQVATRYVDLFDFFTQDEFGAKNEQRRAQTEAGGQKHTGLGDFDREILGRVQRQLNLPDVHVLHPALFFNLFKQFWLGNQSIDFLWRRTRFDTPPRPAPLLLDLPEHYVAAKFYAGTALPNSESTRSAVREIVSRLAARSPVVVLDTGLRVDEHQDYLFDDIPGVRSVRAALTPRANLGLQTQIIAGARQFVGTCGSLAWLAPLLGVPTLAVYADDRLLTPHLMVARHAYRATGAARFSTVDLRALEQLRWLDVR